MNSLYQPEGNNKMVERLMALSPNSRAKWGKMNVTQMLGHCQHAINIPFEEKNLKRNFFWNLFGNFSKTLFISINVPFQKNLPTSKSFIITEKREFEKERAALISVIQQYQQLKPTSPTKKTHPIFGKLSNSEWDKLAWKHLDHHFRQFDI